MLSARSQQPPVYQNDQQSSRALLAKLHNPQMLDSIVSESKTIIANSNNSTILSMAVITFRKPQALITHNPILRLHRSHYFHTINPLRRLLPNLPNLLNLLPLSSPNLTLVNCHLTLTQVRS